MQKSAGETFKTDSAAKCRQVTFWTVVREANAFSRGKTCVDGHHGVARFDTDCGGPDHVPVDSPEILVFCRPTLRAEYWYPNTCIVNGDGVTCPYNIKHDQVLPGNSITAVSVFVVPRDRIFALGAYGYGGVGNTGRRFTVNVGPFKF